MDLHFLIVSLLFVALMVEYCQSQAIEQCPALCSTRPCPESEDEHCLEWDDWGQCLSCEEGYFHKHVGSPCVSCTETFGSSCNYCINNYGCGSCNCYELVHDIVCNLRFCGIENDDESSTLIDSCDDTDEDTEDTTDDATDTKDTSYTNSDESTDLTDSVVSDSTDSIDTNSGNSNNNNNIDDGSDQSGGSIGSNGSGVSQNGDGDDEKSKKPSADGVYVFVVVLCLAALVPCMKMYKNRTSNPNQQMNGPNGMNRSTSIQMARPQLRPTQSMQSVHSMNSMHSVHSHQSRNSIHSIHSMHSIQSSQSNNSYNSYNSSNIDDNIWAQRARKSTIDKKAKLARQNSTKPMINDGVAVAVYS